ncbi:uncharacterized protein LOC122265781 [Penaeus japonicus]|uniref:uncharacterized protein LOC122265781 n=1 Tax=Penaeus japonicus TaxID=27405 RepID=UPI001C70EE1B|nr:uncharacterized protein LOC122265781 [Penaeus japonicus]
MQTKRIKFILLSLLILRQGHALRCYGCTGHDPSRPYDVISNNPACADGQFDAAKLQVYSSNSNRFVCYAVTYTTGVSQVTHRYMTDLSSSRVNAERTIKTTFAGYYCPADLCNGDATSASDRPCLAALTGMLAMASLGTVTSFALLD